VRAIGPLIFKVEDAFEYYALIQINREGSVVRHPRRQSPELSCLECLSLTQLV